MSACRWDAPVFTGAALRPQFPHSEGIARAKLLLHKPWRDVDDLWGGPDDTWPPEFTRFPESESFPMALKVSAERARAATRARNAPWGDPAHADVVGPVDFDEGEPRIYARHDGGAGDLEPDLGDSRDYGDSRDWEFASLGAGRPGNEASATWRPKRVAQFRPTWICDDMPEGGSPRRRATTRTKPMKHIDPKSH